MKQLICRFCKNTFYYHRKKAFCSPSHAGKYRWRKKSPEKRYTTTRYLNKPDPSLPGEIWACVQGHPNYEVSTKGRVRRNIKSLIVGGVSYPGMVLRPFRNTKGYLQVSVGKRSRMTVHRLVANTFIYNPQNKEEINHINGRKEDNRVENLEWCTQRENLDHAIATGLRGNNTVMIKINNTILNLRQWAIKTGIPYGAIKKRYARGDRGRRLIRSKNSYSRSGAQTGTPTP